MIFRKIEEIAAERNVYIRKLISECQCIDMRERKLEGVKMIKL